MTNSELYFFSDFTHNHYKELLDIVLNNGMFTNFSDKLLDSSHFILWRHDIDFSIEAALRLANIEAEKGIQSIFFVHLHSMFYNFLEKNQVNYIKEILKLGHQIGLHFDCDYYQETTPQLIEPQLLFEKSVLETTYEVPINVFSFHNPTPKMLQTYQEWRYGGMINTYANFFRNQVEYCSDSNGIWRFNRLFDFLESPLNQRRIQVLTHPVWWTPTIQSPKEKIWSCIDQQAISNKMKYNDALNKAERPIIDW